MIDWHAYWMTLWWMAWPAAAAAVLVMLGLIGWRARKRRAVARQASRQRHALVYGPVLVLAMWAFHRQRREMEKLL